MIEQIFALAVVSVAVASITWTVTQEKIFEEFRENCQRWSRESESLIAKKFFYIFTCEYCFSHWVTLALLLITGFRLLFDDWRGYVMAFFVVPWFANQSMSLYRRLRVEIKHEDLLAKKVEGEK